MNRAAWRPLIVPKTGMGAGMQKRRKLRNLWATAVVSGGLACSVVSETRADYLWAGRAQHWGKIVAITNEHVEFQINCRGAPQKFTWRKASFALTFSEGCGPADFESWGEPVNCRSRGRLFVAGNAGASGYYDLVKFENDVLILGSRSQKAEVKAPRKEQTAIWLGCE